MVVLEKIHWEANQDEEPAPEAAVADGDQERAPLQGMDTIVTTAETQAPVSRDASELELPLQLEPKQVPGEQVNEAESTKIFKCTLCPKKLFSVKSRYTHIRKMHLDLLLQCPEASCGKRFSLPGALEEHVRQDHPREECQFCNKRFSHKAILAHHLRFGHPCGHGKCQKLMALKTPEDLVKHIKGAHNEDCPCSSLSDGQENKYFHCVMCSKLFDSSGGLVDHCTATHKYMMAAQK